MTFNPGTLGPNCESTATRIHGLSSISIFATCRSKENNDFLAGHFHPGFSLKEKTAPASAHPAFSSEKPNHPACLGSFNGIRKIKPVGDDRIFMTNGQEIIEVPTY